MCKVLTAKVRTNVDLEMSQYKRLVKLAKKHNLSKLGVVRRLLDLGMSKMEGK